MERILSEKIADGKPSHEWVGECFIDTHFESHFVVKYVDREVVLKQAIRDGEPQEHNVVRRDMFDQNYNANEYNKANLEDAITIEEDDEDTTGGSNDEVVREFKDLTKISGFGPSKFDSLEEIDVESLEDVKNTSDDELMNASGVGKTLVERMRERVGVNEEAFEDEEDDSDEKDDSDETEGNEEGEKVAVAAGESPEVEIEEEEEESNKPLIGSNESSDDWLSNL